ncbi:NUDIX domain-containing protein [Paenibacillus melissococcoides]|uniref:NUDIX domain-containing protein n=1 Tax=Paenibacillus melissococcoides TaxID=2912268 RepID=A0ABN8UAW0_9BACL|nr:MULTISPECIES: NUDIX domain-containing protein [Paenibacillus]MEB9894561.1 NUDIX domain-containing protein [Bacillus cereus]CAH8248300.1 NUDIX domain-containing protein [Paenibacillus melissococcoides]CAH8717894.1 NUDIX domain-containing protein [Paenibacillus melissococcoides]CAH8719229.1 NUDIX domain-containing protein [Paenibacillus melissococcoides]GIO80328.1 DNA mismatch repair protein MutT [Paenibacillus dendritiformis]
METSLPRIGVGAVIRNEANEILLVLRGRQPEKDKWSIPGGKVDLYETLEDTTVREVMEEVGLHIQVKRLLCTAETINPGRGEHWISVIFETRVISGEASNREEGGALRDVRWFPLSELPDNLASFTWPAIQALRPPGAAACSSRNE